MTAFIGEIRMFGGNFAPAGWMFCEGQVLPIDENDALFNLIGTTYGGDWQSTFALPDLRGRLPVHVGVGSVLGEAGGVESVTLTPQQIPGHTHPLLGTGSTATASTPRNAVLAASTGATVSPFGTDAPLTTLAPESLGPAGGSQPHENLQPYLCISFIISLFGIFPSPT
jgi:microcystin-dependent protein